MSTQRERAAWRQNARVAVKAYQSRPGASKDIQEAIIDLSSDLLHLAVSHGIDPSWVTGRATDNWTAERENL